MDIFATIGFTAAAAIGLLLFLIAATRQKKR
jgi:hypothetical protein